MFHRAATVAMACAFFACVGTVFAHDSGVTWRLSNRGRRSSRKAVATAFEARRQAEAWLHNPGERNASFRHLGSKPSHSDLTVEHVAPTGRPLESVAPRSETSYTGQAVRASSGQLRKVEGKMWDTVRECANVLRGSFNNTSRILSRLMSILRNIQGHLFDASLPLWLGSSIGVICICRSCGGYIGFGRGSVILKLYIIAATGAVLLYAVDLFLSTW